MNEVRVNGVRPRGIALAAAALIGLGLGAGGCVKQSTTLSKPPDASMSGQQAAGVELRIDDLTSKSKAFADLAKRVQVASADEVRPLMQQAFASLVQILPQLAGGRQGGVFGHQLSVVEDARAQLASRSKDLSADPIIGNGLLATWAALSDARQNYYFQQEPQIEQSLTQFGERANELRATAGATHALITGDAVVLASQVITQMSNVLADRLSETPAGDAPVGPASAPATAPSAAPAPATPPPAVVEPAVPAPAPAPAEPPAPAPAPTEPPATPPAEPAAPAPTESPAAPAPVEPPAPAPAEPPAPVPADPAVPPAPPVEGK